MSAQDMILVRDYLNDIGVDTEHMTDEDLLSYWLTIHRQAA